MQDYYYYSDSEEQHKYYSRSDFRDQYCISERNLSAALERSKSTNYLFSCIGSYDQGPGQQRTSPCKSGSNPFTSCYSGRRSGYYEEEEQRKRRDRSGDAHFHPHSHHRHPHYSSDGEGGFTSTSRSYSSQHYIKRPPQRYYDRKYIWNEELERYIECSSRKLTRYTSVPLQRSSKHVSFDQEYGQKWAVCGTVGSTSLERLIEYGPPPLQPITPRSTTPQLYRPTTPLPFIHRTQSTQTEETPVKQSAAAQTNGGLQPIQQPQRKLEKTYSDGEILLERRKALKTSFQDVQLNQKREPYLFKYKIDDTFHERFLEDGLLRDSFETSSRLQTSEDEDTSIGSSSAGSYLLNNLPPLPPSPNGLIEEVRISPPEDFADNGVARKKRSFRSKSEETSGEESRPTHYRSWHGDLDQLGGNELEGLSINNYSPSWICISELQESLVWRTHAPSPVPLQDLSMEELEFYKRFTATTHRLVHRKASAEVYRRVGENRLEITHRTTVSRSPSNEFGFRIHGSRPVVVSAVERSTPADVAGLRVGDVLITLNGVQVLDSSHSHVVQIANVELLEMELCSTSLYFKWEVESVGGWEGPGWRRYDGERWGRRHLHLAPTCVQVYYTTDYNTLIDLLPLTNETKILTSFVLESIVVYPLSYGRWMLAFESVDERAGFLRGVRELGAGRRQGREVPAPTQFPPLTTPYSTLSLLRSPDSVLGPLNHFSRLNKSWSRYECVLHKCVLYFYNSIQDGSAIGAVYLHGYKVVISNTTVGGRKWIFQLQQLAGGGRLSGGMKSTGGKDYFFAVEGETERKRWLAALEYSIDRWLQVGE